MITDYMPTVAIAAVFALMLLMPEVINEFVSDALGR